jgi:hypothetical protein
MENKPQNDINSRWVPIYDKNERGGLIASVFPKKVYNAAEITHLRQNSGRM